MTAIFVARMARYSAYNKLTTSRMCVPLGVSLGRYQFVSAPCPCKPTNHWERRYNYYDYDYGRECNYSGVSMAMYVAATIACYHQYTKHHAEAEGNVDSILRGVVYCICANCEKPIIIKNSFHKLPMNHYCSNCSQYVFIENYEVWYARRTARLLTNFVPFAGPVYKMGDALVTGNPWLFARGSLSLIGDVCTAGGASPIIENALDLLPDGVELVQACLACDAHQTALLVIAVGIGVIGAGHDQRVFTKAAKVKEARKGVSNVGRAMQKMTKGDTVTAVKINGQWTKSLRVAAKSRDAMIKELDKLIKNREAFKFVRETFDTLIDDGERFDKLFDILARLEINAWSTKRAW